MAKKYRTTGPDVLQQPPVRKPVDPLPPSRVPIFNKDGHMVGHVGRAASSATVSRFTGTHSNKLGRKNGRDAWIATAPSQSNKAARAQKAKLVTQLKTDKGSNR